MTDWRPIDTAPRDGTPILAQLRYADGLSGGAHVIQWEEGTWRLSAINSIRLAPTGDPDDDQEPTHWMPLPAPPQP